jgi:nitrous oxidase accessory protein NosD
VPISGQINPSQASGVSISKWVLVAAGIILGLTAGFAFSVLRHRQSGPPSPIAPLASQPRNLTVGSGGQYQMISAAMEQARPGDSVEVFPGEYSERIRLKEGVALISQRPREAVILSAPEVSQSAGVSPQTAEIVAVIANGIRGARLIGFRIIADTQHPLDVGLRIINSVVEVTDNQIEGARQSGVFIEGAASTTLRANLIRANLGAGVTIREQAVSQLLHNIIIGNGAGSTDRRSSQIKQFRPGIELINHPQVSLVGNIFAANRGGLISGLDPGQREIVEQQNFATKDLGHLTGIPVQQAKVQR